MNNAIEHPKAHNSSYTFDETRKVPIPLERISWNVYFGDIVTVQTYVFKNNYIF
jgi:hypothetical protein